MNTRLTTSILLIWGVVLSLFSLTAAAPLAARDVYDPPILVPNWKTVWHTGEVTNVTWDVSNPPVNITNNQGMIYLAQGPWDTSISGPGGYLEPLASGFPILIGTIQVTVPNVKPGLYKVVVMGDSGNASHNFTIM